ncbi:MAG: membrane protein insertion efficiency factor YidD [Deltaproteobacteria bacterium]|nr:membrane protein insertion efficiency factor YidD [Deltaproteobacteria bacterium]MDA8180339.1 membrane protein insertion efficiency factor YidD [Deltaproteobacteria bacterium]
MRPRHLLIGLLRLYQTAVSPYIGDCCRFHPSCSEYMIESIRLNGSILGVLDGIRRIGKCHPFHPGGVDLPRRIQLFGTRARWKNG